MTEQLVPRSTTAPRLNHSYYRTTAAVLQATRHCAITGHAPCRQRSPHRHLSHLHSLYLRPPRQCPCVRAAWCPTAIRSLRKRQRYSTAETRPVRCFCNETVASRWQITITMISRSIIAQCQSATEWPMVTPTDEKGRRPCDRRLVDSVWRVGDGWRHQSTMQTRSGAARSSRQNPELRFNKGLVRVVCSGYKIIRCCVGCGTLSSTISICTNL